MTGKSVKLHRAFNIHIKLELEEVMRKHCCVVKRKVRASNGFCYEESVAFQARIGTFL